MLKKLLLLSMISITMVAAQGEKADSVTHASKSATSVVCPVMNKTIDPKEAVATQVYKGKTYYLCCGYCKSEFKAHPEKYVK